MIDLEQPFFGNRQFKVGGDFLISLCIVLIELRKFKYFTAKAKPLISFLLFIAPNIHETVHVHFRLG